MQILRSNRGVAKAEKRVAKGHGSWLRLKAFCVGSVNLVGDWAQQVAGPSEGVGGGLVSVRAVLVKSQSSGVGGGGKLTQLVGPGWPEAHFLSCSRPPLPPSAPPSRAFVHWRRGEPGPCALGR